MATHFKHSFCVRKCLWPVKNSCVLKIWRFWDTSQEITHIEHTSITYTTCYLAHMGRGRRGDWIWNRYIPLTLLVASFSHWESSTNGPNTKKGRQTIDSLSCGTICSCCFSKRTTMSHRVHRPPAAVLSRHASNATSVPVIVQEHWFTGMPMLFTALR